MHKIEIEKSTSTAGMVDYNQNSSAQQSLISSHDAEIRSLAKQIGKSKPEFRIVDYGCGPGISAITAVKPAIEDYRAISKSGPVSVCHSDQPGNDWNSLFNLVFGNDGYQDVHSEIRTEASIGSFYSQRVEDNSVDLATCFAASHWLSHAVRLYSPGTVWFADLQGEARKEMAKLARKDWTNFLQLRALELKADGFLFVSTLGSIPDNYETNGAAASGRGIYRALQVVAQQMADDSLIDSNVLDHFVFSLWFMTAEEARAPIDADKVLSDAFEIERIDVKPAPTNPTDLFKPLLADPAAYAKAYTGYIRAFADSTLRTQLFAPSAKNAEDETKLADLFYERLEALYATQQPKYAFELWHLTIILRKK
ncbi:MAG: hypothetical protein AAF362_06660 [Pseudomonadota bacterium]